MLQEAITWCRARALWEARKLGFVSEAVALEARYKRCRADWQPHLENSRGFIAKSLSSCERKRKAVLFGAGLCLDIPLDVMASSFEQVMLVDVVCLPAMRKRVRSYPNVEFVLHDVTEVLMHLAREENSVAVNHMREHQPDSFLTDDRIDWVGSINLLSQLSLLPMRQLQGRGERLDETTINELGLILMRRHLHYLQSFQARHVLIYDAEQWLENSAGEREELVKLDEWLAVDSAEKNEWIWRLAPKGELRHYCAFHRVQAHCW